MNLKGYGSWGNRETWAVALCIDSDLKYSGIRKHVAKKGGGFVELRKHLNDEGVTELDGVSLSDESLNITELDEWLRIDAAQSLVSVSSVWIQVEPCSSSDLGSGRFARVTAYAETEDGRLFHSEGLGGLDADDREHCLMTGREEVEDLSRVLQRVGVSVAGFEELAEGCPVHWCGLD